MEAKRIILLHGLCDETQIILSTINASQTCVLIKGIWIKEIEIEQRLLFHNSLKPWIKSKNFTILTYNADKAKSITLTENKIEGR